MEMGNKVRKGRLEVIYFVVEQMNVELYNVIQI